MWEKDLKNLAREEQGSPVVALVVFIGFVVLCGLTNSL